MKELDSNARNKILETAYSTFVELGYKNTTMTQIAQKVKTVSRTTLNYHFGTKENLYKESLKFILKQLIPPVVKILNAKTSLKDKIRVFVENYIKVINNNPHLLLFIINEVNLKGQDFLLELKKETKFNLKEFFAQVKEETTKGNIVEISPVQFFMHITSLCAFPIIAKPFFQLTTDTPDSDYNNIIEERKTEVLRFIFKGLTP